MSTIKDDASTRITEILPKNLSENISKILFV